MTEITVLDLGKNYVDVSINGKYQKINLPETVCSYLWDAAKERMKTVNREDKELITRAYAEAHVEVRIKNSGAHTAEEIKSVLIREGR